MWLVEKQPALYEWSVFSTLMKLAGAPTTYHYEVASSQVRRGCVRYQHRLTHL